MLHYHKKVCQMIKSHQRSCPTHGRSAHPTPSTVTVTLEATQEMSIEGQFDQADDLGQDPYNLLKTPMDTLVQDKTVMPIQDDILGDPPMAEPVTEAENHLLDDEGDNLSVASSSQGK